VKISEGNPSEQNRKAMLEYAKVILPKVSFSKQLFSKELNKCIHWVEPDQIPELYSWCYENFKEMYPDVLAEAFAGIAA
jgi:hypothetical protein